MIILSIETSCDETAISIVEATGDFPKATYKVLGNALFSQIEIHREFGGVFPAVAKREHIVTIVPMLKEALAAAKLTHTSPSPLSPEKNEVIETLLYRESGLAGALAALIEEVGLPPIDLIAVTTGPGLEPALWVGINFAKALATITEAPVIPVDHMEGHILASIFDGEKLAELTFPAISLLISGGHTELILMRAWGQYEKIGVTRDDAVGEAFDKVARLLGLPYPGGPEISRLAKEAREANLPTFAKLPAPMINSGDLDFSFSGLKTAVRNLVQARPLTDAERQALARDFEDIVVTVLKSKLTDAVGTYGANSVIIGGGVAANTTIREAISDLDHSSEYPDLNVFLPNISLSTDNSVMIALAGHAHLKNAVRSENFATEGRADGNKSLDEKTEK